MISVTCVHPIGRASTARASAAIAVGAVRMTGSGAGQARRASQAARSDVHEVDAGGRPVRDRESRRWSAARSVSRSAPRSSIATGASPVAYRDAGLDATERPDGRRRAHDPVTASPSSSDLREHDRVAGRAGEQTFPSSRRQRRTFPRSSHWDASRKRPASASTIPFAAPAEIRSSRVTWPKSYS